MDNSNIFIRQGDSIIRNSRLDGIDASDCSGSHSLYLNTTAIFDSSGTTDVQADSNNVNWLRFYLSPKKTSNLEPGQYTWCVRVTDYTSTPNVSKESSYDIHIKEGLVNIL